MVAGRVPKLTNPGRGFFLDDTNRPVRVVKLPHGVAVRSLDAVTFSTAPAAGAKPVNCAVGSLVPGACR